MKLGIENKINGVYFGRLGGGYAAYLVSEKTGSTSILGFCTRKRYYWVGHLRSYPSLVHSFPTLQSWAQFCCKYAKYNCLKSGG